MEGQGIKVFEELKKSLVGVWEGKTEAGRQLQVAFRLVAADTVLVETWTLAPGHEALTLYHIDHEMLMATHYCPLGNQPRLVLKEPVLEGSYAFEFVSATDLASPAEAHQHRFEIKLLGADSFWRSETYVDNGAEETEGATYARAG